MVWRAISFKGVWRFGPRKYRGAEEAHEPVCRHPVTGARYLSVPALPATMVHPDIRAYHAAQPATDRTICETLAGVIVKHLPDAENKIWHRHPVWFLDGNPIVGYSKLKNCIRLLFWSGQSFGEPGLSKEGSFKAAEKRYTTVEQVDAEELAQWLKKAREIQWDYKNIVKRRGVLERLT